VAKRGQEGSRGSRGSKWVNVGQIWVNSFKDDQKGKKCQVWLGRCEKLIFPPIITNHILKVAYGHKKNNKTIHLTLGILGDTALS
jgi:hypothetical protein